MQDVQQAAVLFHSVRDETWEQRAEHYLTDMRIRLEQPGINADLFETFIQVQSPQQMFQLVQQHPQLLTDQSFSAIEALIASEEDEQDKAALNQRLDTLKQMRQTLEQEAARSSETINILQNFAEANWDRRRQLMTEHADLLLNETIEQTFDLLLESARVDTQTDADAIAEIERLRILLRRCRTWGIDLQ